MLNMLILFAGIQAQVHDPFVTHVMDVARYGRGEGDPRFGVLSQVMPSDSEYRSGLRALVANANSVCYSADSTMEVLCAYRMVEASATQQFTWVGLMAEKLEAGIQALARAIAEFERELTVHNAVINACLAAAPTGPDERFWLRVRVGLMHFSAALHAGVPEAETMEDAQTFISTLTELATLRRILSAAAVAALRPALSAKTRTLRSMAAVTGHLPQVGIVSSSKFVLGEYRQALSLLPRECLEGGFTSESVFSAQMFDFGVFAELRRVVALNEAHVLTRVAEKLESAVVPERPDEPSCVKQAMRTIISLRDCVLLLLAAKSHPDLVSAAAAEVYRLLLSVASHVPGILKAVWLKVKAQQGFPAELQEAGNTVQSYLGMTIHEMNELLNLALDFSIMTAKRDDLDLRSFRAPANFSKTVVEAMRRGANLVALLPEDEECSRGKLGVAKKDLEPVLEIGEFLAELFRVDLSQVTPNILSEVFLAVETVYRTPLC